MNSSSRFPKAGFAAALGAHLIWGVLPLYIQLIKFAGPLEIVAVRILFAIPATFAILAVTARLREMWAALSNRRLLGMLTISGCLIGVNWLLFAHAVVSGHVLSASLAYFLTPLAQIALGVIVFKEPISRFQIGALGCAALGIAAQAISVGPGVWVSLVLCLTWAFYGLTRKIAPISSAPGLAVETLLLAPLAAAGLFYLSAHGGLAFGQSVQGSLLLAFAGVITAAPLILFTVGARALRMSTVGVLQFITPSAQFLIGLTQGEHIDPARWLSFGLIWLGIVFYTIDALRRYRQE